MMIIHKPLVRHRYILKKSLFGVFSGSIFLQIADGYNVTVNGDRYRDTISGFFEPEL